ncbi:MAG TPA: FKBP-type peptidyl-prolyl cis-trans isomerase, partial [Chitinophaga sp.]
KGWDAGLATLKKGDKATLVIPSSLAYGLQGSPPAIPSNSVLVFTVQLVNVVPGKPKAPAAAPGTAPAAAPKK